jgi:starvation-inducible DNA-binding protein
MSKTEMMNKYVANLAVLNVKLHNLHWNVVGLQFMSVHNFTEQLYDDAFQKFDDVAEKIKMSGETPVSTIKEYLELASISEVAPKNFSTKEVLDILIADLKHMRSLAMDIREAADQEGDFGAVSMFEDHVAGYDKNLWFLSVMIK